MVNALDYMDKMQLVSVTNIQFCLSIIKSAKTTPKWVSTNQTLLTKAVGESRLMSHGLLAPDMKGLWGLYTACSSTWNTIPSSSSSHLINDYHPSDLNMDRHIFQKAHPPTQLG